MLLEYQILPKELVIRVDDQFRRPDELNPDFTYELIGLAENDSPLDINVSITTPVSDGNISNPTPIGVYEIIPSAQLSSKYFYSLQMVHSRFLRNSSRKLFLIRIFLIFLQPLII